MDSFLSETELLSIGLKVFGKNVLISKKASIYKAGLISIGDNVRVDDFCVLSGPIQLGSFIHIAAFCAFYGGNSGITVGDYANFSSRISVYAISDDYSGFSMTNPMIPDEYKNLDDRPVHVKRHVIIGSGSVVLPGVTLGEGCAIGALSLVKDNIPEWTICGGVPAKFVKNRDSHLLALEEKFTKETRKNNVK